MKSLYYYTVERTKILLRNFSTPVDILCFIMPVREREMNALSFARVRVHIKHINLNVKTSKETGNSDISGRPPSNEKRVRRIRGRTNYHAWIPLVRILRLEAVSLSFSSDKISFHSKNRTCNRKETLRVTARRSSFAVYFSEKEKGTINGAKRRANRILRLNQKLFFYVR